ncbi:hypothetical protein LS70_004885 [Helicobacter sp. MIT 11-5569]|uniref:hypothetical protein n=1 Tax=Helicobacter sp. MIT 11-5569 TaxID=1548151 RepID=UPI00051FEAE8|nr:hypothetical protein [Helicobacter sp. MIT 11-5569]TLD83498.1 hypothetical protein LS70_004885 [Helicobacter sp. MIT 11-5569]
MEEFAYKLVMFGFSALCEDLDEVKRRLNIYPTERYELENGDECFLVELSTRTIYPIVLKDNRFVIEGL